MITVVTRVYNDATHIINCLNGFIELVDEVVVIEGVSTHLVAKLGLPSLRSTDGTIEALHAFIRESPHGAKIKYYESAAMTPCSHHYPFWDITEARVGDFVFIVDSDEVYVKDDFKKVIDFAVANSSARLGVMAYNMLSPTKYRSDSFLGPIGIGGMIVKYGKFNTDRHLIGDEYSAVVVVPGVTCFHFSLMKPLEKLKMKLLGAPEIKEHWVIVAGEVVFVDGTSILEYKGILPDGYRK